MKPNSNLVNCSLGDNAWGGLLQNDRKADLRIVGVPFDGGAGGKRGAALGPDKLRSLSSKLKTISRRGVDLSSIVLADLGDVEIKHFDLKTMIEHLHHVYRDLFAQIDAPILTLGGDHSITYPIATAAADSLKDRTMGIVWFDAHPDCLDSYLGSPLSHGSPLRRIIDHGKVDPSNVLLVGTRAFDRGELDYLADKGIHEIKAVNFDDDRRGSIDDYHQLLKKISHRVDSLYVTVDIDVLDASIAPGTGTPVSGGLTVNSVVSMMEMIDSPVIGYDIVEFAPNYDLSDITSHAVFAIANAMVGRVHSRLLTT